MNTTVNGTTIPRWMLVSPQYTVEGDPVVHPRQPFLSIGMDWVRGWSWGGFDMDVYNDRALGYAPFAKTNMAYYGNNPTAWEAHSRIRLLDWGFNTLAGASYFPNPGWANMSEMVFMTNFQHQAEVDKVPIVYTSSTWHKFVDVFDPGYEASIDKLIRTTVADKTWQTDLIGWFIDNELPWDGNPDANMSLVDYWIQNLNRDKYGKKAWITWLTDPSRGNHYSNPTVGNYTKDKPGLDRLNVQWGTNFSSWDITSDTGAVINAKALPTTDAMTPRLLDKIAFFEEIAGRYYGVTTSKLRAADPQHLIFSDRYMASSGFMSVGAYERWRPYMTKLWFRAGQHCDAFCVNVYYNGVKATEENSHVFSTMYNVGFHRPILVTETNTQGNDTGYFPNHAPDTWWVATQMNRAKRYQQDLKALLDLRADPNNPASDRIGIGYQWYSIADNASDGFGQAGMLNSKNEFYSPVIDSVRAANKAVYDYCGGTADLDILPAPTGLTPALRSQVNVSRPTISWGGVSGAKDYKLIYSPERSFVSDSDFDHRMEYLTKSKTQMSGAYTPTEPMAQGWYYWTVAGRDLSDKPGSWLTSSENGMPSMWRFEIKDIPWEYMDVPSCLKGEDVQAWRQSAAWENNYAGSAFICKDTRATIGSGSSSSLRFYLTINARRNDGSLITAPPQSLSVLNG